MTPRQVDELRHDEYEAMVRHINREAQEIKRQQRAARRR